ncbi:MAG: type II toxin-antitoxin system RelE/ParE family toxin [Arenicellales bacterium]
MTKNIFVTRVMQRDIKRLKKKYPKVLLDLRKLNDHLSQGQILGDAIAGVSEGFEHKVYKVRLASSDQNRGKRGGFRVIYYVVTEEDIYLLSMYAKAQRDNIRIDDIQFLLDQLSQ